VIREDFIGWRESGEVTLTSKQFSSEKKPEADQYNEKR